VATLAWAGFLPNTLHGIGISPGSARITLELGNTNVVPKTFTVSFWPTGEGLTYWTSNYFVASEFTSSNLFFSFDPIQRVSSYRTPDVEGHATNTAVAFRFTVYLSSPTLIPDPPEFGIRLVAEERWTCADPVCFFPSVIATITAQVIAQPIASNQVVTTTEDMPVAIGLTALWQTGLTGTFAVVSRPVHGVLSGTAPALTYTPGKNYAGPDNFTFTVNSGGTDSPPATVSITVNELNTAPVLFPLPDLIAFAGGTLEYDVPATPVRGLIREVYEGVVGTALTDLTNAPHFPDDPSRIELVTNAFEPVRDVSQHYGQRLRGLLIPPVSGDYIFGLQGDGSSLLYLSGDEQPEHKAAIACQMEGCWGWQSGAIRLEAGSAYYLEALMKRNPWSGDGLVVQWRRAPSLDWQTIPGTNLLTGAAVFDTDVPANALTFELDYAGGLGRRSAEPERDAELCRDCPRCEHAAHVAAHC
jgi:hypothetical protein